MPTRGGAAGMMRILAGRECGQRSLRTLAALPLGVQGRLNREHDKLSSLVLSLAQARLQGNLALVRDQMKRVSEFLGVNMPGEGNTVRESFVLFGGAQVVVQCLQVPVDAEEARNSGWRGPLGPAKSVWELRKECLVLLRDLCFSVPALSEQLCSHRSFIVFLFSLMRDQNTFDEAVGLTEEVLAFRGEIFSLANVPDFEGLVTSFSKRQMAFFCRVLALVVFEPEDRPSEELQITKAADLLMARREQAMSPAVKNTDRNHAVLLGIEELLPRMVKLVLVHAAPMSRWADEIMQHLPTPHHYDLFNILGVEDGNDWDDEPVAGSGSTSSDTHESIKALALLAHQVEVLFVMCTLLAGKRKAQVQDRLMELDIVPALLHMFDRLDWNRAPSSSPVERIHGPGCECNPESALRIQYLRLVHNLSDREHDRGHAKHQFLSKAEIQSVEEYAAFDGLKQYVFLGGGSKGDGVLRCPAASADERWEQPGAPADLNDDHDGYRLRDGMWDQSLSSERCCEQYLFNSHSAASTPSMDTSDEAGHGAATGRWIQPPQTPASRNMNVVTSKNPNSEALDGVDSDQEAARQVAPTAAGGCTSKQGQRARRNAAGGDSQAEDPSLHAEPVLDGRSDHSDTAQFFGRVSSFLQPESRNARPNTRRVQEGSARTGPGGEGPADYPIIKEQDQGLISRILHVFMRETPDSTYRFWLASCIEAFLRGSDVRSQVLMARSGLLRHLVDGILNSQGSGNLQTNFDLLGELVKCNPEVFTILNEVLDDSHTYTAFMQVVVSNLVDSNVFLRAVILSLEFFSARRIELQTLGSTYNMTTCNMRRFFQHNTIRVLRDLMTVITVEEVNQENICCLNTALSLFILARSHGQLHLFIETLYVWETSNQKVGAVTGNFLALLKFWLEYYLYRGKDCLSLELSSSIHFSEWRSIVNDLVNRLQPEALAALHASSKHKTHLNQLEQCVALLEQPARSE